jgi:hypothetical protein
MERGADNVEQQIIDICFAMNGGITWDQAWNISFKTRERIVKSVNKKQQQMSGSKKEYM